MYDTKVLDAITRHMLSHNQTIAVAESVTSGNLQVAFSLASDASQFYQGGITAYNIGQKCRHLHIDPIHALSCNCVSEKIAIEMATNACKIFVSDWGIGITGYASPMPECSIKKLFACYAFAFKGDKIKSNTIRTNKSEMVEVQQYYTARVLKEFIETIKNPLAII